MDARVINFNLHSDLLRSVAIDISLIKRIFPAPL